MSVSNIKQKKKSTKYICKKRISLPITVLFKIIASLDNTTLDKLQEKVLSVSAEYISYLDESKNQKIERWRTWVLFDRYIRASKLDNDIKELYSNHNSDESWDEILKKIELKKECRDNILGIK